MPILAAIAFSISVLAFGFAILLAIPIVPSPESWRGLPALIGLFFFALAEFLARGGLPGG